MLIDRIFQEMGIQDMTGIDDIETISLSTYIVGDLILEYKTLFEVDGHISLTELEDYFGSEIEITEEYLDGGFEIQRRG